MSGLGVIIVCYRTPSETKKCVEMYLKMSLVRHIVVVDNEARIEDHLFFEDFDRNRVTVIYQTPNWGYSAGNNIGIRYLINEMKIKYIIISNSDVEVEENVLVKCWRVLRKKNNIGAVAPKMKDANGNEYALRILELGYLRVLLRVFIPERKLDDILQKFFFKKKSFVVAQSFLPGSLFMVKSSAILDCNGFDENVFLYREEEILGKRMKRAGYKEAVLTNCFYIHNHKYNEESSLVKLKRNKIVMKSERYYFKEYKKSSCLEKGYVYFWQIIYTVVRGLEWKISEVLKKNN